MLVRLFILAAVVCGSYFLGVVGEGMPTKHHGPEINFAPNLIALGGCLALFAGAVACLVRDARRAREPGRGNSLLVIPALLVWWTLVFAASCYGFTYLVIIAYKAR